jgi:hypothetical protein
MEIREEIQKDIDKYKSIAEVLETDGGKIIKEKLESDFFSLVEELISKYKTVENLVPIVAGIDKTLDLLRTLTGAESNKDMILEALKREEK